MSDRTAITIYAGGRIADVRLFINWGPEDLLCEAITQGLLCGKQDTVEGYCRSRFGASRLRYVMPWETLDATPHNLEFLERMGDSTITLDLTAQAIYTGPGCLSREELERLPCISAHSFAEGRLEGAKICLDRVDGAAILDTLRAYPSLTRRLSENTCQELMKSA